jgi:hypothetical protein
MLSKVPMIKKEKIILCFDILINSEYESKNNLLNFLKKLSTNYNEVLVFTEKPIEEIDCWLKKQKLKKYILKIITKKPTSLVLLTYSFKNGDSFESINEIMSDCNQNIFFPFSPLQTSLLWLIIFEA